MNPPDQFPELLPTAMGISQSRDVLGWFANDRRWRVIQASQCDDCAPRWWTTCSEGWGVKPDGWVDLPPDPA